MTSCPTLVTTVADVASFPIAARGPIAPRSGIGHTFSVRPRAATDAITIMTRDRKREITVGLFPLLLLLVARSLE